MIGLPLGGFAVSLMVLDQHSEDEERRLKLLSDTASLFIEREIESRFRPIGVLRQMVDAGIDRDSERFRAAAEAIVRAQPGYIAINRIDADRIIVAVNPEERNREALGRRVGATPEVAALLDLVERTGSPMATAPVTLFQRRSSIAGYFPVSRAGHHNGFVNAVIDIDVILREFQNRLDPTVKVGILGESLPQRSNSDGLLTLDKAISILGREAIVQVSLPADSAHAEAIVLQIGLATVFFTTTGILFFFVERSRKVSEQERQRLKDAIEALPFGFALAGADGRLIVTNSGLGNMFPGLRDMLIPGTRTEDLVRHYVEDARGLRGPAAEEQIRRRLEQVGRGHADQYVQTGEGQWHRIIERRTSEGGIAQIRIDVSELQRAKREAEQRAVLLVESEVRYQHLVKAIGVITWTLSPTAQAFASLDGACDQILGFPHPDRLRFGLWLRRAHRDDRRILLRLFRHVADGGGDIDLQFRMKATDGRFVWLHAKGAEIMTASGPIMSGLMFDVTAQRAAEAAQASAQAMLASAIESLGDWVALYGPDDCLITINSAYRRYSPELASIFVPGRSYEEIIRAVVMSGAVLEAIGREEQWILERLQNHRTATSNAELQLADGGWLLNRDYKLPDGSTLVVGTNITALKQASAAVELERLHLRDAIESLPASFLMFDREERLVVANQAGFERHSPGAPLRLGMTAEEIAHAAARLGFLGTEMDERELVDSRLARFRQSSSVSEYRSTDGRWWQIIDRPTHDGGRIALRLEVTELKETGARLAETNRRFQAILDNAPVAIFLKDREDRYILTNRRFDEWYLGPGRSAVGMTTADLLPAHRAAYIAEVNRTVFLTASPVEHEINFVGPAVGISHVMLTSFPITNQDGIPVAIAGFISDITARRKSEARREAAENELRAVMDHTVDGLITIDERGTIATFSKPAERIFGYGAEEVIGKNVSVLMPEPYRSGHDGYLSSYMGGGSPKIIGSGREVVAMRKDKSTFPADLAVGEIPSADGSRRFVGTLRDISARKEMEQRLEQSQRIEALGRLTGGVAHDFNNVLAAITINLEMLLPASQHDPESMQWLDTAIRAAFRGRSLTRQLLATAGRQSLQPRRLNVRSILHETQKLLQTSLGSGHQLRVDLEDNTLAVLADAGSLESALLNLVLNARDAEPDGGIVMLSAARVLIDDTTGSPHGLAPGSYVRIDVTDTGVGMSAELKAKVFEPFFTTKEIEKGSGLGLSMVFGFARQSGGSVHIESEVGLGTTVSLYLPTADSLLEQPIASNPVARDMSSQTRRILLVEDEELIRDSLATQLARAGFDVASAASADEALVLADRDPNFDLLLSDFAMPGGKTGVWLAQALRQRRPGLPALLMSGYVGDEKARKEIARLGLRVLKKPFNGRALLEAIEEALLGPEA